MSRRTCRRSARASALALASALGWTALGCGEEVFVDPPGGTPDSGAADRGPPAAPPRVESTEPAAGAVRVPTTGAVEVTFSAPMVAPNPGDVALRPVPDGELVALEVGVDGPTLRFVPRAPLAPRTPWVLRIDAAANRDGIATAEPVELRFTTGGTEAVPPALGELATRSLDCRGRQPLPPEIAGDDGLGALGWTFERLHVPVAWPLSNRAVMPWISDNSRSVPSARIDVERTPETGRCFVDELRGGLAEGLAAVIRAQSAFHDASVGLNTLTLASYAAPEYPDAELNFPLASALWGLFVGIEPVSDAPDVEWSASLREAIEGVEAAYPTPLTEALADFVHAVGEAHVLRESAAGGLGSEAWAATARSIAPYSYDRTPFIWWEPITVLPDLKAVPDGGPRERLELFELQDMSRAGQRVAQAAEALAEVARDVGAFDAPALNVETPLGRFVVRPSDEGDAAAPDDAALVLDLGGNDAYPGRVGSTHLTHLAASVLIDVAGDDTYGPQAWALRRTNDRESAFAIDDGLTQGAGLFGVGLVIDVTGDDTYRSTVFGQGIGLLGVGALYDLAGNDRYDSTFMGQGTGQLGAGLLVDVEGDDAYTVGSHGQGVGRPRGQGVLLDGSGHDDYLALHDDDAPQLLEKYPLWFPSGYTDELGEEHNMSVAMGVGWGFRGDWFPSDQTNWAGGFGAAVDLGDGDDVRFADAMSMGQGFVYGMGLLYDDGGDDIYRAFWWSFGSGTHMGTGLMIENGGHDDLTIGQFSAALGHDTGISWYIDRGGDDRYAGQMTYGRALDQGLAFFVDEGGNDIYEGVRGVNHGICDINPEVPVDGLDRLGLFMDLGGGQDAYLTPNDPAENDAVWYQAPHRGGDPEEKQGIGLDR